MESLTPEQQTRLDALIAALERLPTAEAILASGRLRSPEPLDETGKRRFRRVFAGAVAAEKLLAYITALEEVDDHRGATGRKIFRLRQEGERLRAQRSLAAARPLVEANHLAGQQEVDFHFFAVCVGRIERFLPLAAKAAGHKIPAADRDLLASFRPLRDYYEHLEDRLPAGSCYDAATAEVEQKGEWRILLELTVDAQQRLVMGGVAADVTTRGVADVRDVLRRHWEALKPSAVALVRQHFEADPSAIPDPETISGTLFVSLGGRQRLPAGTGPHAPLSESRAD